MIIIIKTEEFKKSPVYKNFKEISNIPRNSFNEKAISDFLFKWAKELGLEVYQDERLNIFIRKNATWGYEDAPTVLLQAHMDMVCDKSPNSDHDFSVDPIEFYIDGDLISTRGKTTLGADNGIGVAYILSILESEDISHPRLEALLTTVEEEDMSGAINFNSKDVTAEYLINLDHANDKEILIGSCGGMGVKINLQLNKDSIDNSYKYFRISVDGLLGGHSGEDIHRGNGNANILLGRILNKCKVFGIKLIGIKGGNFRLAIPREAEATIAVPLVNLELLKTIIIELENIILQEYGNNLNNLRVSINEIELDSNSCFSDNDLEKLILILYMSPNGILEMNNKLLWVVESSCNVGEVYIDGDNLIVIYEIRATLDSQVNYTYEKIKLMCELVGANDKSFSIYPGWKYNINSNLKSIATNVYVDMFGEEPNITAVHAGIECGCLIENKKSLDAISIGPNAWGFHSPTERVSISSIIKVWEYLKQVLSEIK